MPVQLLSVTFEAVEPARAAEFWGALLPRPVTTYDDRVLLAGDATQVGLAFVPGAAPAPGPARLHLHLTSTSDEDQDRTVATALSLGARHLDVGQLPEEEHVVLADPAGYAFCVIEPGNTFLAGCGFLGEVACDGGREVGVFWSEALGWSLVWDQDDETAIQSPLGGTKVAWGGDEGSVPPSPRQRFDLTVPAAGLDDEVARLVALGATVAGRLPDGGAALTAPGGDGFHVVPG